MSDIDITIGNAKVLLWGEILDGETGRNKRGASNEVFIVDDVLHATSRMMSVLVDSEVNEFMQRELTRLRQIDQAASRGICGNNCGSIAQVHNNIDPTCALYWIKRGRVFNEPCPTCEGPVRETINMICQTCGKDYS